MPHVFPHEIVEIVVNCLRGKENQLRKCALVSVAWAGASQRVLFRHIDLSSYSRMTNLLPHLICSPHLPKLIRSLTIHQMRIFANLENNYISRKAYMTCLTAILTLLPHITSLAVDFADCMLEGWSNQLFLDLLHSFLPLRPLITKLDLVHLSYVADFEPIFTLLKGTSIRRINVDSYNVQPEDSDGVVELDDSVFQLPLVEHIRVKIPLHEQRFHYWLSQRQASFPNLKCFEIFMASADDIARWCDVLQKGLPSLKECRFDLPCNLVDNEWNDTDIPEEEAYRALPLGGLHVQHIQFGVVGGRFKQSDFLKLAREQKFVEWWACVLSTLASDKATIHFTELTFTFTDLLHERGILAAWESLDKVLSQKFFSCVQHVHFETKAGCIITDTDMAAKIRVAMPQLASRNVLCFS
ncbi:hypothetical protein BDZ89DRAFT_336418 [Hymenopellis radicata]|nr:hypothetical protein BDZ89DRAFT_336418 [Hymenopellis radicata]